MIIILSEIIKTLKHYCIRLDFCWWPETSDTFIPRWPMSCREAHFNAGRGLSSGPAWLQDLSKKPEKKKRRGVRQKRERIKKGQVICQKGKVGHNPFSPGPLHSLQIAFFKKGKGSSKQPVTLGTNGGHRGFGYVLLFKGTAFLNHNKNLEENYKTKASASPMDPLKTMEYHHQIPCFKDQQISKWIGNM